MMHSIPKQLHMLMLCFIEQLRRGADQADILSMAFSANSQLLVLSSSKGTVHIFRIKANEIEEPRRTERSTMLVALGNANNLFQAGSILLSSAAATAGSSYTFVKGIISHSYGVFLIVSWLASCLSTPDFLVRFGKLKSASSIILTHLSTKSFSSLIWEQ